MYYSINKFLSWFSKGKQLSLTKSTGQVRREIMIVQSTIIIVTLNPFSTFLSDNNYCHPKGDNHEIHKYCLHLDICIYILFLSSKKVYPDQIYICKLFCLLLGKNKYVPCPFLKKKKGRGKAFLVSCPFLQKYYLKQKK